MLIAAGAGLLLGAAFLDLLPEAISLGTQNELSSADVLGMMLICYLFFYVFENGLDAIAKRWLSQGMERRIIGRAGAAMLIFHSFRDGMAIGAAYAASHPAGYAVAFGIAAHDLGDGMNTVILTTGGDRPTTSDSLFLIADALAPGVGVLLTAWWVLSPVHSVFLLVLAARFFLHMATADFLPRIRRCGDSRTYLLLSVLLGALLIYVANLIVTPGRSTGSSSKLKGNSMTSTHIIHENHTHQHGADCGHTSIQHENHTDFLHDGHLHHVQVIQ